MSYSRETKQAGHIVCKINSSLLNSIKPAVLEVGISLRDMFELKLHAKRVPKTICLSNFDQLLNLIQLFLNAIRSVRHRDLITIKL